MTMREKEKLLRTYNVLLAEDDETDALFARQAFEHARAKLRLHIVSDGRELIKFLNNEDDYDESPRPNLIIIDINMPKLNGIETLKIIKAPDSKFKDIPVIMLSGSNADSDIRESYANYANAYMMKSVGFTDMIEFINCIESYWISKVELPRFEEV